MRPQEEEEEEKLMALKWEHAWKRKSKLSNIFPYFYVYISVQLYSQLARQAKISHCFRLIINQANHSKKGDMGSVNGCEVKIDIINRRSISKSVCWFAHKTQDDGFYVTNTVLFRLKICCHILFLSFSLEIWGSQRFIESRNFTPESEINEIECINCNAKLFSRSHTHFQLKSEFNEHFYRFAFVKNEIRFDVHGDSVRLL